MTTIYLVRHGQASFRANDYDQLSLLGYDQAEVTGRWFRQLDRKLTHVVSGTLHRHLQTRSHFLQGYESSINNDRISIDLRFDEMQFHNILLNVKPEITCKAELDGWLRLQENPEKSFFSLYKRALERWISAENDQSYTESWERFKERCLLGLQEVAKQLEESDSAVVITSGGPISVICMSLLGIDDEKLYDINRLLMNTSVTTIKCSNGRCMLTGMNNNSHLELAGKEYMTLI